MGRGRPAHAGGRASASCRSACSPGRCWSRAAGRVRLRLARRGRSSCCTTAASRSTWPPRRPRPPPWLTTAHPEILPVDRAGHTLWPGSRQHGARARPSSASTRWRLVSRWRGRYGRPPGRGRPGTSPTSWAATTSTLLCDVPAAAFRRWLAERYDGDSTVSTTPGAPRSGPSATATCDQILPPRLRLRCPTRPSSWTSPASPPTRCWTTCAPNATCCARSPRPCRSPRTSWSWATPVRSGLRRVGGRAWTSSPGPLPRPPPAPPARRAGVRRRPHRRGRRVGSWLLMESATCAVNWQPVNVRQAAGRAARGLAAARRARRRRASASSSGAPSAGGRGEVPLGDACRTPGRTRDGSARWSRSARR